MDERERAIQIIAGWISNHRAEEKNAGTERDDWAEAERMYEQASKDGLPYLSVHGHNVYL